MNEGNPDRTPGRNANHFLASLIVEREDIEICTELARYQPAQFTRDLTLNQPNPGNSLLFTQRGG
jgi:hypothetical protein